MTISRRIRISIDRGGTFTDVYASVPGQDDIVIKILSVDPANYPDAPTEGIRRVLELIVGHEIPRGRPLDLFHVESIRMGTTVATNALLERKGERVALVTTQGFRDLLVIGNQTRRDIFDLSVARPEVLYDDVIEVDERVTMEDYTEDPSRTRTEPQPEADLLAATTGETIRILRRPDLANVKCQLQDLKDRGFSSIAIVFIHSYAYPEHEKQVAQLALNIGLSVTSSSDVQSMINVVPRGNSAIADAYLTPIVRRYVESISSSFIGGFDSARTRIEFMQSDGGLVDYRKFSGLRAIFSGPGGGVVGYSRTSWDEEERTPIVGFDMGGTSTDVSRFDGSLDHVFEANTAGISLQAPTLNIQTVAAGGGSILSWRSGLFNVGPESASAHPGPACYRKGGPLTVTDANLFLGRLLPEYFPKMFGPEENEPLCREIVESKFAELSEKINQNRATSGQSSLSPEEVALGFLKVANESMARPIRQLTESKGYSTGAQQLASFGGAGGQHACEVADILGISRIIIHRYSSILSAYGISLADVVHEIQRPAAAIYAGEAATGIHEQLESLGNSAVRDLFTQGFEPEHVTLEYFLNLRYEGSSSGLMIKSNRDQWDFKHEFEKVHKLSFGFYFADKDVIVDDIRVRATGLTRQKAEPSPAAQLRAMRDSNSSAPRPSPSGTTSVHFERESSVETPYYELDKLSVSSVIEGPAIVLDKTQTIIIIPGATATILDSCVLIDLLATDASPMIQSASTKEDQKSLNPIQLTVFGHRFMSIAEQMGRTLQKTAVSTNIKERNDFSCAIFSPDGGLVANAPHVPVHLGSMSYAVKYQAELWRGRLHEGDSLVSNHPSCGGTHLPDITVITPFFDHNGEISFYVASRGHHADIGGILPGSMPPVSFALWQEGAAIESTKLVSDGVFREDEIRRLLLEVPSQYEGCSGTRRLEDNISDLKAQIAANAKGISQIKGLIVEFGLSEVHRYMYGIQDAAAQCVRDLLKAMKTRFGSEPLHAVDYMDDGTKIELTVKISTDGTAIFDFEGTGPHVLGNTNAPIAITNSAIIYCLRAMVSTDIPLNQGCLDPVTVNIPRDSILNPGDGLAVVGGNVLTSQRVTDVVLKCFRAAAASQGCCNNLTFGTGGKDPLTGIHHDGFGYYETIAGGAGAGPEWTGSSGVHTHMTNTRITDPEVLEKRYPVVLRRFQLRKGSGGQGRNRGGDGTIRDIEFRVPVQCSILSERRSHRPYGLDGGEDGQTGLNLVIFGSGPGNRGRTVNLGAKATTSLQAGDRVVIHTPGGGGWGRREVS